MTSLPSEVDVAVIGAGAAGIAAARRLAETREWGAAATVSLASMERRVERWGIGSDERSRLRLEIATVKSTIATLEQERAKRM